MAVYAITGKLGSGKGKAGIDQIRRYLRAGKRVATNCDVFLEHLMSERDKGSVIRVPDKPNAVDLYMIGSGNKFVQFDPLIAHSISGMTATAPSPLLLPGFDESHNGALVLDECGSWLNTRNFQDKGRAELLEWAIHARKYGWDIFFIMQNISQVDKQLRDSLLEYVVRLNRLDRMKVPFVSSGLKMLTAGATDGSMPRMHIGVVRLGPSPDGIVADRWMFRGDDLNRAYNTTQVFSDAYPHGTHCLLSAWHLSARVGVADDFVGPIRPYARDAVLLRPRTPPPEPPPKHMTKFLVFALLLGGLFGAVGSRMVEPSITKTAVNAADRVFTSKVQIVGVIQPGGVPIVVLSDGRTIRATNYRRTRDGHEAQISSTEWARGQL